MGIAHKDRFDWSEEKVEKLKSMWLTHSRTVIANELGCSRNAVIGKGLRIGLPKTVGTTSAPRAQRADTKAPRTKTNALSRFFGKPTETKPKPVEITTQSAPESRNLSLTELTASTCKFAVTGHDVVPSQHRFCGNEVSEPGVESYCRYHARVARQPRISSEDRRRKRASQSSSASKFNPSFGARPC